MLLRLLRFNIYESNPRGVAALWCPACDTSGHNDVREIRKRLWIWVILPLWSSHVCEETCCRNCGLRSPVSRGDSISTPPDIGQSFVELAEQTNPELLEQDSKRNEIAEILVAESTSDSFQRAAILRRLESTAIMFEYAGAGLAPDRLLLFITKSMAVLAVTLAALFAAFCFVSISQYSGANAPLPPALRILGVISGILFLLFIALIPVWLIIWLTRVDRFIKREAWPVLVRILAPLQPTEEQLIEQFALLKPRKLYLSRVVKPRRLARRIEAYLSSKSLSPCTLDAGNP